MGGWALFAGLAAAALLLLWRLRFARPLANFALAAVMLAAAGYAWQGRPALAGSPTAGTARSYAIDDETLSLRNVMFGRFGTTASFFGASDAMMRFGAPDAAAQLLQAAIGRDPGSVALWTQLGTVIATRDAAVSPAAAFAFRRAMSLSRADPAPWFFMGLAQVRAGEFAAARTSWAQALRLTSPEAGYRPAIAQRLALLDRFLASPASR